MSLLLIYIKLFIRLETDGRQTTALKAGSAVDGYMIVLSVNVTRIRVVFYKFCRRVSGDYKEVLSSRIVRYVIIRAIPDYLLQGIIHYAFLR